MSLTDYAKYLLNVCGKRFTHLYQRHYLESDATLPSLSALLLSLRTMVAGLFTQIKARGSVHPLSGLPETETLATLPTALATLNSRKVDVGTSTQVDDGVSLVRLLCDSTEAAKVTELVDTNSGWSLTNRINFDLAQVLEIHCSAVTMSTKFSSDLTKLRILKINDIKSFGGWTYDALISSCPNLEEVYAQGLNHRENGSLMTFISGCAKLNKLVFGTIDTSWDYQGYGSLVSNCPLLIHLEFGENTNGLLDLRNWSPTLDDTNRATFLQNFRQYIFLRLADRTATTALTLTLSSAVYTALTTETRTLAELGITTLTDKEQAAGITLATAYNTWLDTYRAAINWNVTNAG